MIHLQQKIGEIRKKLIKRLIYFEQSCYLRIRLYHPIQLQRITSYLEMNGLCAGFNELVNRIYIIDIEV